MKSFLACCLVSCLLILGGSNLAAQNFTTITASNIGDASGNKLAQGKICFSPADANGNAINFAMGGGGQALLRAVCKPVINGAISGTLQVANPMNTAPAGITYTITVYDTSVSTAFPQLTYKLVQPTGATWSFDAFQPTGIITLPLTGGTLTGPISVNGSFSVTGTTALNAVGTFSVDGTINLGYGCNDDGVHDDTSCVQGNLNAAGATGCVKFPPKTIATTGTLTIATQCVKNEGAVILYSGTGVAINVNIAYPSTNGCELHLPTVDRPSRLWSSAGPSTDTGVSVLDANGCTIFVPRTHHYTKGLDISPSGFGVARNTFMLGDLNDAFYGLNICPTTSNGFTNINTFIGGYWSNDITLGWAVPGMRQIRICAATNQVTGNAWVSPDLEGQVAEYMLESWGADNKIVNGYWENVGSRSVTDASLTNGSATITISSADVSAGKGFNANADVGQAVTGSLFPANTTILSVTSTTVATASANATGTSSTATLTISAAPRVAYRNSGGNTASRNTIDGGFAVSNIVVTKDSGVGSNPITGNGANGNGNHYSIIDGGRAAVGRGTAVPYSGITLSYGKGDPQWSVAPVPGALNDNVTEGGMAACVADSNNVCLKMFTDAANSIFGLGANGNVTNFKRADFEGNTQYYAWDPNTAGGLSTIGNTGGEVALNGAVVNSLNTVTFSATPTFDCSKGPHQKITLTGTVTSSSVVNCAAGMRQAYEICQDGTGGHTFAAPSALNQWSTIQSGANACSLQIYFFETSSNAYPDLMPGLTGDVTSSPGSVATTLASVVTAGTNTKITYNAKGLVTAGAQAQFTDLGGSAACGQLPALTGAVTTSAGSCATSYSGIVGIAQGGTNAATAAAGFNNLNPMTTTGDTIYESAANTASRLAGNTTTTKEYLSQTGSGSASAAPLWAQIAFADLSGSLACGQLPGFTGDVTKSAGSCATTVGTIAGTITSYNGVSTVANGLPQLVAKADATAQGANISSTTLYAVPSSGAGMYRVNCYTVVTRAATTSSSLPACDITWTDLDTNTAVATCQITNISSTNVVGATGNNQGGIAGCSINVKASTNISYTTAGYASSGATSMQYAIHLKLEYLGN